LGNAWHGLAQLIVYQTATSSLNKRYADAEDDDDAATQSKRLVKRKLAMPVWAVILVCFFAGLALLGLMCCPVGIVE
jgi:1,4-dihydroxy-2-naphthoate octaprenyltransferase